MKLAILDRDGVVNYDSDLYIKSPAEWRPIPGSIEAIARLNQGGYRIAVASNQSGIGRGLFDMATLNAINDKMMEMVFRHGGRIDAIFFCPHTPAEDCNCRKPRTGMYEEIAVRFHTDLKGVPCIGDMRKDLEAAEAVGAQPILVLTGKGRKTRDEGGLPKRTLVFEDLAEASRHLVQQA
ncbi:MAG TPA: D-glycero-beta-D-manno-heptose 1,7-bisphosphate 7-phosphatase [Usitatibacter sp.]|nr:D-glycero-beta-D-manno-heptose 1,7-bisphosphate 7-phosphatase [Usitatibacter sp.]